MLGRSARSGQGVLERSCDEIPLCCLSTAPYSLPITTLSTPSGDVAELVRITPHSLRCVGCRHHVSDCICEGVAAQAERLRGQVHTRVVVVMHAKEMSRASNTGFLLPSLLEGAEMRVRGALGKSCSLEDLLRPEAGAVLLFNDPGARLLDSVTAPVRTLVVADGSWRQAGRMVRRDRVLRQLPQVYLPLGQPSRYRLRGSPRPGDLCTLESTARALEVLEGDAGPEIRRSLESVLEVKVEATLGRCGKRPEE